MGYTHNLMISIISAISVFMILSPVLRPLLNSRPAFPTACCTPNAHLLPFFSQIQNLGTQVVFKTCFLLCCSPTSKPFRDTASNTAASPQSSPLFFSLGPSFIQAPPLLPTLGLGSCTLPPPTHTSVRSLSLSCTQLPGCSPKSEKSHFFHPYAQKL